jgi:putative transposon-encoded protein
MKTKDFMNKTTLTVDGIEGFMVRKITKFGTGAKVDCLKEHIGKTAYIIICKEEGGNEK